MAIAISKLNPGDKLYEVCRRKAGNTTMSVEACSETHVLEVGKDETGRPWVSLSSRPEVKQRFIPTGYTRHPKEWLQTSLWRSRTCHMCHNSEDAGHKDDCDHPKAAARQRAAKGSKASAK